MVATNTFLQIYLRQAERAHSILNFVYDARKRREFLSRIKQASLDVNTKTNGGLYALYNMCNREEQHVVHKMTFYELIKQAHNKMVAETRSPAAVSQKDEKKRHEEDEE